MPKPLGAYRLPHEARFDLTYRCNNHCRHCWLRIPPSAPDQSRELSFEEIRRIVDEARALGTRRWSLSGGEPMLRPDFAEIFDYITAKALSYSLNTNGTLLTPALARLLKRKGKVMVALYGATKETYDHVARHPGGFELAMQGFRYLQEAGTDFIVQLVPMKANWHEWEQMKELAQSLSSLWRVGAPWLYLSSCQNPAINTEIARQRLDPCDVVALDTPNLADEDGQGHQCGHTEGDGRLFASCIAGRRDFHIDPYGGMSFCSFLKEPSMRYNLRTGTVREGWEEFIPSLAEREFDGAEHREQCGSCDLRNDCRWCAVYGWLEHGRFSAPVQHLCDVAREEKRYKEELRTYHRRFFTLAGITFRLDSDLSIGEGTFHPALAAFRTDEPGSDMVTIQHHFELPDLKGRELGTEVYRTAPWAIYEHNGSFVYLGIADNPNDHALRGAATLSDTHTALRIYNDAAQKELWHRGALRSLTMFLSDQHLLARLLADRQGCVFNAAALTINGSGLLVMGSEADQIAIIKRLTDAAATGSVTVEVLSDRSALVRRTGSGWQLYGSWCNGAEEQVSAGSARLRAICCVVQDAGSSITSLTDGDEALRTLLAALVVPLVTGAWWQQTIDGVSAMAERVPCAEVRFDMSGAFVADLSKLVEKCAAIHSSESLTN